MFKKTILLLIAVMTFSFAKAQTADEVYEKYLDFNLARLQAQKEALDMGIKLAPNADKLNDKTRINFYNSLGKLYEDDDQSIKAQEYYEKVAVAVPDYYVARRALGYIYAKQAEGIATKLNAAQTDVNENKRLRALYTAAVKKALPHLEKAQACDPSEETLTRIKALYKNIQDTQGLNSLDTRLRTLSKNCIDLLDDK